MDTPKKDKYKKVAYYPGCALEGTGHAYNRSTKAVGKALGLDLVEVDALAAVGLGDGGVLRAAHDGAAECDNPANV